MIEVKNILVPTDFSAASDSALDYARELSRRFGAAVHLLHVVDIAALTTFGSAFGDLGARVQADLEAAARGQLDERRVDGTRAIVSAPSPLLAIVDYARTH